MEHQLPLLKGRNGDFSTSTTLQVWVYDFYDALRKQGEAQEPVCKIQFLCQYLGTKPKDPKNKIDLSKSLSVSKQVTPKTQSLRLTVSQEILDQIQDPKLAKKLGSRNWALSTLARKYFRELNGHKSRDNINGFLCFKFYFHLTGTEKNYPSFGLTFRNQNYSSEQELEFLKKVNALIESSKDKTFHEKFSHAYF